MSADALLARDIPVKQILDVKRTEPHHLTFFAKRPGTKVLCPGEPLLANLEGE